MKRIVAIMFVGVFLVPAISSAGPPTKLEDRVAQLEALVASLQAQLNAETTARVSGDAATLSSAIANAKVYTDTELLRLDTFVTGLENYVTVDTTNNRITFTGVNLQLVNGTGGTYNVNGKGNLIIGYDTELVGSSTVKNGSHNLVIGDYHTYSSAGGFVAGYFNRITNIAASISGGYAHTASGQYSSVSGGLRNAASGYSSSVSGGTDGRATGYYSSVSGGTGNSADGTYSSVSGGDQNTVNGESSSVSGGFRNAVSGWFASVSGGTGQNVTATYGYAPYP